MPRTAQSSRAWAASSAPSSSWRCAWRWPRRAPPPATPRGRCPTRPRRRAPASPPTGPWPPTAACSPSAGCTSTGRWAATHLNAPMVGIAPTEGPVGRRRHGVLDRRLRRRDLRLRRCPVPRLDGRDQAQPPHGGDRRRPRHRRLLDGRLRRRDLRLRRPVPRIHGGAPSSPRPWSPWWPRPTGGGTGSSPPTAGCSPSATPPSRGRWAAPRCPARGERGRARRRRLLADGRPTAGCSPSATPATSDRWAAMRSPQPARGRGRRRPRRVLDDRQQRGGDRLRRRRLLRVGTPARLRARGGHRRRPGHRGGGQRRLPLGQLRVRRLDLPGQPARPAPPPCRRDTPSASSRSPGHRTASPTSAWPRRRHGRARASTSTSS